jgi:hypothetical protein
MIFRKQTELISNFQYGILLDIFKKGMKMEQENNIGQLEEMFEPQAPQAPQTFQMFMEIPWFISSPPFFFFFGSLEVRLQQLSLKFKKSFFLKVL